MKKLLSLLICLFTLGVYSQMYVSPNSYIFVNDQAVFVKQDLELNSSSSNFYLRNNSQLLQGTTLSGSNKGIGDLSVYQEGTVNNYQYNYWSSPVGNTLSSTSVNNPFGISQLKDVTGLTTYNNPNILAMNNYDGSSTPLSIAPYWIFKFITSSTYNQWTQVGSTNTLNAGEGFTMKGTSGSGSAQRYDFRGKPNDGTITTAVSLNNFTLIGNPYPSAINLDSFLLDISNSGNINGTAYFWEQVVVNSHYISAYQGGYGIYTPGTGYTAAAFNSYNGSGGITGSVGVGNNFKRRFSPIGQGFMVRGTANGSVTMKNSFRVFVKESFATDSEFARNTSEYYPEILNVAGIDYTQVRKGYAPQLKISAMYDNLGIRPTTLAFDNNTTDGFDYGWDGKSPSSESKEFYYIVNGEEYIANAVSFSIDKKIPVGFKCNATTNFKIRVVDVLYGFDTNQNVYIHDKQTDIYYDIKNGMFDMDLPAGDNRTRFEITFQNSTLGINHNEVTKDLLVYQNISIKQLTIKNPSLADILSVEVYDILGKLVINRDRLGNDSEYTFNTSSLSSGVYIVKVKLENDITITKKITN